MRPLLFIVIALIVTALVARAENAVKPLWEARVSAVYPVAAGEVLCVFTADSSLVRLDANTGCSLSRTRVGFVPISAPVFSLGLLYAAAADGFLYALDSENGRLLWKLQRMPGHPSDLAVDRNILIVGCGQELSTLCGYSTADGRLLYSFPVGGRIAAAPSVCGNVLYVTTTNGRVYTADFASGLLLDSLQTLGEFYTQRVVPFGERVLLSPTGDFKTLVCLPGRGALSIPPVWTLSFARESYPDADALRGIALLRPVIREKRLKAYLSKAASGPGKGATEPDFYPAGPVHFSAWTVNGTSAAVVVKEPDCFGRALYRLVMTDELSGKAETRFTYLYEDIPHAFCAAPVLTANKAIVLIGTGTLSSINRENGKEAWTFNAGRTLKGPLAGFENTVVVADAEGVLMALSYNEAKALPREFALLQNRPNPFNPATTLRYQMPVRCEARITIYDARGRQVAELFRGMKPAGSYTAEWNGRGLRGEEAPTGIYFAEFKAGPYAKTVKMALVK